MKGTIFENSDIELYLTEEESKFLGLIKIGKVDGKRRVVYESLECGLQKKDGSDSGTKIHLQIERFEALGDGIKVEYKEGTCFVKMSYHASNLIDEIGSFETRNVAGEKITIYISERMPHPI